MERPEIRLAPAEGVDVEGARDDAPAGLVDRTVSAIRQMISDTGLGLGDPLPAEAAIAVAAGVSRPVVREALRSLSALGIVDLGNGRRARVSASDFGAFGVLLQHAILTRQASIQQIYDVRRTVELRTVALAALRRSPAEAREIADHATAMLSAIETPEEVMRHDIAFHSAIARASRNPLFELIMSSFMTVTRDTWPISWSTRRSHADRETTIRTHLKLAEAILAKQPAEAERLVAEHFDTAVRALIAAGFT